MVHETIDGCTVRAAGRAQLGVHALQEAEELIEFGLVESAGHMPFELSHLRHQRLEFAGAGLGQEYALAAAVAGRAPALDQATSMALRAAAARNSDRV